MRHRLLSSILCVLLLGLVAGCGATATGQTGATQPTATTVPTATQPPGPPTPLNVPADWQVYSGQHFTMAYPSGWTYTASPVPTGLMGQGIMLTDPAGYPSTGQIEVLEEYGFSQSQLQAMCQLQGTTATLARLSMKYTVGEGIHRNWLFINSNGVAYTLDAMDANKPQAVQQQHDAVLATFRPDDPTAGCVGS